MLLHLRALRPLGNLSGESNQEDVFPLTPSLPLVDFFLPDSVEGRNCHSDLQYRKKKKNSSGLFGKASTLNFSGNYAGIDLFLLIYLLQFIKTYSFYLTEEKII